MRSLAKSAVAASAMLGSLVLAYGCGDDEKPPPVHPAQGGSTAAGGEGGAPAGGTSGGKGTGGRTGGTGGASSAGAAGGPGGEGGANGGVGGEGGAAGGGGTGNTGPPADCPPEPTSGTPPSPTPDCDIDAMWSNGTRVTIPVSGNDALFSITPDELTIAWTSIDVFTSAVYTADRASTGASFGTPTELTAPPNAEQLALSPDGLRLVAVVSGRFQELTRSARNEAFGAPGEGAFTLLNARAQMDTATLADPVIAPSDTTLYYSVLGTASEFTLRVSTRTGTSPWPVGTPLDECEFKSLPSGQRRPTGISADGLTLFYYDNPRGRSRAAFRPALDWPFLEFAELPMRIGVQPNAACDRIYFSGMGMLPLEVLYAEAN